MPPPVSLVSPHKRCHCGRYTDGKLRFRSCISMKPILTLTALIGFMAERIPNTLFHCA